MKAEAYFSFFSRFLWPFISLIVILIVATIGYWYFGNGEYTLLDCFYMAIITISTIGYTEIVDLQHSPAGRIFNIVILISGIGVTTYVLSTFTASIVEGKLSKAFSRKKMDKKISELRHHYIVCGGGIVGIHLIRELAISTTPILLVDNNPDWDNELNNLFPKLHYLTGDATDTDTLIKAGVNHAAGLFANTLDDNVNLMIVLTAKHINPNVRVISQSQNVKHVEKIKAVGAESVIVPQEIGGSRMASEMINPRVTSFLNVMLHDQDRNLCIEEVPIPKKNAGMTLASLDLRRFPNVLILAVKHANHWVYNPPRSLRLQDSDSLVLMTTPKERKELEKQFGISRD